MWLWLPRVIVFVAGIGSGFEENSLPEWMKSITPRNGGPSRLPRLSAEETARVIANVLRWNRGRFNNGCFVRSFTRYRFFRESGYPVVFHLGIEECRDADPRSHAWLSLDGVPFLEFEPERFRTYRVLFSYPET
jgi:hypothetical protein